MGKKATITVVLSGRKLFLFSPAGLFPSFVWLTSLLRLLFPLTHLSSKFHYNSLNCGVIASKCSEGHTQRRHSIGLHVRQFLDIAVPSVVVSLRVSFNTLPSVQTVWNYQAWRNILVEAILTWLILNVCHKGWWIKCFFSGLISTLDTMQDQMQFTLLSPGRQENTRILSPAITCILNLFIPVADKSFFLRCYRAIIPRYKRKPEGYLISY